MELAATTAERDRVWRNSRDLLAIVDADGIFRSVNLAWTEILGCTPQELVGNNILEFAWPDDAELTQEGLDTALSKSDLTNFHTQLHRSRGIGWYLGFRERWRK